jgi:hypothetical protein
LSEEAIISTFSSLSPGHYAHDTSLSLRHRQIIIFILSHADIDGFRFSTFSLLICYADFRSPLLLGFDIISIFHYFDTPPLSLMMPFAAILLMICFAFAAARWRATRHAQLLPAALPFSLMPAIAARFSFTA